MSDADSEKKTPSIKGTVYVERERCKGCGFCVAFCPTNAIELDPGFNNKGYHPPVLTQPLNCTGCNICGIYCPDFAIFGVIVKKTG